MPKPSSRRHARAKRADAAQRAPSGDMIATKFVLCDNPQLKVPWQDTLTAYLDRFVTLNRTLLSILITEAYWSRQKPDGSATTRRHCLALEFKSNQPLAQLLTGNEQDLSLLAIHPASDNTIDCLGPLLSCDPVLLGRFDATRAHFAHAFLVVFYIVVPLAHFGMPNEDGSRNESDSVVFVSGLTQDVIECHPFIAQQVNAKITSRPMDFAIQVPSTAASQDEAQLTQLTKRSHIVDGLLQGMCTFRVVSAAPTC